MEKETGSLKVDMDVVLELMNDTCNLMARKIRIQEREIQRLRYIHMDQKRGTRKKYREN